MYDFEHIYEPASVDEAIQMMNDHPEALILAGGSDLLVQLRSGAHVGCDFISIYMLDELRGISMDSEGTIRIGALTSFSYITKDPIIQTHVPVLGEAVDTVGGPQIRNIGTIGGNICNGHTGADSASTLFALDAYVELKNQEGITCMPIAEFYKPQGGVSLKPGQLLTAVLLPEASYKDYYGTYFKYAARNAMDVDIVGCSVNVKLSDDKTVMEDVRISYGVVGPNPVRAKAAEAFGKGKMVNEDLVNQMVAISMGEISPRTDYRGSKEFRTHIAKEICTRMLKQSIERAGGRLLCRVN